MSAIALIFNYQRTSIAVKDNKEKQLEKKKAKIRVERTKQMGSKNMKDTFVIKKQPLKIFHSLCNWGRRN
ncbi:hypothetical protein [Peribacillus frigoritolerans]|uniref:hypothetical protein n=1 Tax=Peribacillus frigoritolerans TaxID=450367 RepID=UPI003017367C